jgi:hypothetical protein
VSYSKDAEVPPLPIEAKRVISKRLVELFYDGTKEEQRKYFSSLFGAERVYAIFWWQRETQNPDWRKSDPHQGKPMKAHLSLVR